MDKEKKDNNGNKKKKKSKQKLSPVVESIIDEWETAGDISDVLGSYTGNPVDRVQPEQDADDL